MGVTTAQLRVQALHRSVADKLGVPAITLGHKALKGTFSVPSSTGNVVYKGPGPISDFVTQFTATYQTYWITMPFTRAEQRMDDATFGIASTQMLQAQIPALDNSGNPITIESDDFIVDTNSQFVSPTNFWRVANPVPSPDFSFYTFIAERQR